VSNSETNYSTFPSFRYASKLGVLVAVLVGLTASKTLTEKRNEFFREAGSGYNIDAYYCAVNIVSTVEHSIQVIISSMLALWLRNSLAAWYSYYINFLLLAWLCVSWALFFPLVVQPKSVVLVTGFYMVFFSLLFSGSIDPIKYKDIYDNVGVAIFSGLLSPTRYFVEAMAVAESKCLPVSIFSLSCPDCDCFLSRSKLIQTHRWF
jgi:membrane-associated HD superfamily phosphohydrolase